MTGTTPQSSSLAKPEENRILIIDNNKSRFLEMIKELQTNGVAVEHISDRSVALQVASNLRPHIVLMNLFLNSSSTISLIREMRSSYPQMRIIVITAHYSKSNIQECVKAGANDFILEPFDMKMMLQRIRYQLQERLAYQPDDLKDNEPSDLLSGFQLVYDCLRIISEVKDAHPAIHECLKKISTLSQASRVNVVLGDIESNSACILASSDDPTLENLVVDLEKYPEVREVILNGSIIYIKDITANPLTKDIKAQVKSIEITSLLVLPIRHRQETIGTLNIRIGKAGPSITDKHLRTFYMAALSLSAKVAAKKMLKKLEKGTS